MNIINYKGEKILIFEFDKNKNPSTSPFLNGS